MWPVPASTTVVADSASVSIDFFSKDGRKIFVGDCALFKPPQDSPPFIGIIRRLSIGKEEGIKLSVNWLYRPAEIKLVKSYLLEAAPNEIFYSFHKDEIPAASLLHPCKVAFLCKGVELPSGISSFVCRRVYDIENKCLWWLTDQDYINERQEEVDKLIHKTRQEMHGAVQPGGRSPKLLNGPTLSQQLKPGAENVQNPNSPIPLQGKGKKRDRTDQGFDLVKRERLCKTDDGDSGLLRLESELKTEIAKITEKGGLVNPEGVEKLVQLMQPDSLEGKIDLIGRSLLVDVIAVTDRFDCLCRFLQLKGLLVLNEWLQEVQRGNSKESDKSVEDFLLALLRALDKLPVNLEALQTSNVGKSVNHLRSHRNSEIQKKARSLVDTWKKRVEAEMNMLDAKSGSNRSVSWPSKPVPSEVSHVGSRRVGVSSEVGFKSSSVQASASKATPIKTSSGESVVKFSPSAPLGAAKEPASLAIPVAGNPKDSNTKTNVGSGTSEQHLETIKEEKSSSSSQSQNNSQSYSTDHAKTLGSFSREDARSSTAASGSMNKIFSDSSRHQKLSNGCSGSAVAGMPKEAELGRCNSTRRNLASEKVLLATGLTCEKVPDIPVDHGNSQRLIVRLPNAGRSPARSSSGGSFEDPAVTVCRSSPSAHPERNEHRKIKRKTDAQAGISSNANMELCHGNDQFGESDEANGHASPTIVLRTSSSLAHMAKSGKSYDASFSSINALAESCVKFSEACASASHGDDLGMNLLASVAAGEISKSGLVSPCGSPHKKSPPPDDSYSGSDDKSKQSVDGIDQFRQRPDDHVNDAATTCNSDTVNSPRVQAELQHPLMPVPANFTQHVKGKVILFGSEEKRGEQKLQMSSSGADLQQNTDGPHSKSDGKSNEQTYDASTAHSIVDGTNDCNNGSEGDKLLHDQRNPIADGAVKATVLRNLLSDEGNMVDCLVEKSVRDEVVAPEATATSSKVFKEANEDSLPCSSLARRANEENCKHTETSNGILLDQKDHPTEKHISEVERAVQSSGCGDILSEDPKAEVADETTSGNSVKRNEEQKVDSASTVSDQNSECFEDNNLVKKEVSGSCSELLISHEGSSAILLQGTENCTKSIVCKLPGIEESKVEHASSASTAAGLDMAVKLDFDLNECVPFDDEDQGELQSPFAGSQSAVHLPCPLALPVTGNVSSVTVASAAKGPFLPPENTLRCMGELRWKGSAATSAFRPAEPRKNFEISLASADVSTSDTSLCKHSRTPLEFDLNVADDRVLEDFLPQSSAHVMPSESGSQNRGAVGLDLDLNRADDSSDMARFIASDIGRPENQSFPGKSAPFRGVSNGELTPSRSFDLNNGPGPDEMSTDVLPPSVHPKSNIPFPSSVPAIRMSSSESRTFSSWLPPGIPYSAIIPSMLPGRAEQSYPLITASAGSQRILGLPTGVSSFGPEIYRGSLLSSPPPVGFPPATTTYSGLPFETSYPRSSSSFPACSMPYMDSSSGGLCIPDIPQVVGHTGVVPSHYPRQYVINPPAAAGNVGTEGSVVPENRKWGNQFFDLNAGPGTSDVERRDGRLFSALRQLPVASSQAMMDEPFKMYQMTGGGLKRKDPDGGWDTDRGGSKHTWK